MGDGAANRRHDGGADGPRIRRGPRSQRDAPAHQDPAGSPQRTRQSVCKARGAMAPQSALPRGRPGGGVRGGHAERGHRVLRRHRRLDAPRHDGRRGPDAVRPGHERPGAGRFQGHRSARSGLRSRQRRVLRRYGQRPANRRSARALRPARRALVHPYVQHRRAEPLPPGGEQFQHNHGGYHVDHVVLEQHPHPGRRRRRCRLPRRLPHAGRR